MDPAWTVPLRWRLLTVGLGLLALACGGSRDDTSSDGAAEVVPDVVWSSDVGVDLPPDPGRDLAPDASPEVHAEPITEAVDAVEAALPGDAAEPQDVPSSDAVDAADTPDVCQPACDARVCGPDGCTGTCGTCATGFACVEGACAPLPSCGNGFCNLNFGEDCAGCPQDCPCACGEACTLEAICRFVACDGRACGSDGCGGSCGACAEHHACHQGQCDDVPWCGDGACTASAGESCATCATDCGCACGQACVDGACSGSACDGRACGADGCGGSCGECPLHYGCDAGACTYLPWCGDGACASELGETCATCVDCACGCGEACQDGGPGLGSPGVAGCVFLACEGRECGADGCGGSCGTCAANQACELGRCECVPSCAGGECGDDGCGGTCGACSEHQACVDGTCVTLPWCGDGACDGGQGETCASCPADCGCGCGEVCAGGACTFTACGGKACGDDGCGGTCGACAAHHACAAGVCVYQPWCGDGACDVGAGETCATCADCACACREACLEGACVDTACAGLECGEDGCGGSCGECDAGLACDDGACVPQSACSDGTCDEGKGETCASCPVDCGCGCGEACVDDACVFAACAGRACGDDGCGGTCGTCGEHRACNAGACVYVPWCGDGACDVALGETCSSCAADCGCGCGRSCQSGACVPTACAGRVCGPDGCGGSCGECPSDYACAAGSCVFTGTCDAIATPVDPGTPLEPLVQAGPVETTTVNGFTDDYLYDAGSYLKIGTRREWGATVVFFGMSNGSPGQNSTNTIDANDTGREVQVAIYDPDRSMQGCAWNAGCRTNPGASCPGSITYLGWNPVQGGNECNHGSGVESVTTAPGLLEAVVRPLHWNPDWERSDCGNDGCSGASSSWLRSDVRYTQRLRFVATHIVEMDMQVANLSDLTHEVTLQEFPTLYASWGNGGPDLRVVLDGAGQQIPVDVPANDGFYYKNFDSADGVVALQNEGRTYGVGLYYENRQTAWQAWQRLGVFNNVRARFAFGLPARGVVHARAYLILGAFETVRGQAAWLDTHLPAFGALDAPAADAEVNEALTVAGWVLDNKGVSAVDVLVDGQVRGNLGLTVARPDVCASWPGYAICAGPVGFSGTVGLPGLTPCRHLLEVRATDTDGNARVIGARRVVGLGPYCSAEVCNGADDDCDGTIDEAGASGCTPRHRDADVDGWGTSELLCTCTPSWPYTAGQAGDCADGDPAVHPGAADGCNGVDDDCDGVTDPGCVDWTTRPIYRYNLPGEDHMFGTEPSAPGGYTFEGQHLALYVSPAPGRAALYQVTCASCVDHMPTLDPGEGAPAYADATLLGYCSTTATADSPRALRRLHNAATSDHFASASPDEWTSAQAIGYSLEGVLCHVP